MTRGKLAVICTVVVLVSSLCGAQDINWTGAVTVDAPVRVTGGTLTIAPGTVVTFSKGGVINLVRGAGISAAGTAAKPIRFVGEDVGQVRGSGCHGVFEHVEVTGVGVADHHKRRWWLSVSTGKGGITVRNCTIANAGGVTVALGAGPFEMTGCDLRGSVEGILVGGKQKALIASNTLASGRIHVSTGIDATVRGNVLIRGTLSGWQTASLLVEKNYIHRPAPKGSYGLLRTRGLIRNNVVRGGSWVSSQIGGEITANVFISLPHEEARKKEGGFNRHGTHEHICGLTPNSTVVRNIFVGGSYGAVMGIGRGTCSDSVIRNNTFDMRRGGKAIYLNHLPKTNPKNIVIRNNIFMRSGTALDEKGIPDSVKEIDYNLWSACGLNRRYGRFHKITITGKKEGDPGFGGNDVPPYSARKALDPVDVVVSPDVEFPFTDADMLARKHTVDEILEHYRKAYTPKPGSAAINAGSPADKDDPDVKDGKPDIGAIEFAHK